MKVMTLHNFFDADVDFVRISENGKFREVVFENPCKKMLVNIDDAIALAKEFGLVVYRREDQL